MGGRNWNSLYVSTIFMQILISLVIVVLIKGQNSVIWRNIEMIIDYGGIYSCDASDEAITQTFVYVYEN